MEIASLLCSDPTQETVLSDEASSVRDGTSAETERPRLGSTMECPVLLSDEDEPNDRIILTRKGRPTGGSQARVGQRRTVPKAKRPSMARKCALPCAKPPASQTTTHAQDRPPSLLMSRNPQGSLPSPPMDRDTRGSPPSPPIDRDARSDPGECAAKQIGFQGTGVVRCCEKSFTTLRRLIRHIGQHPCTTRASLWEMEPNMCAYQCGHSSPSYVRHETLDHYMCDCGLVRTKDAFESHDNSCSLTRIDPVIFFAESVPEAVEVEDETLKAFATLSPQTLQSLGCLGGPNFFALVHRAFSRARDLGKSSSTSPSTSGSLEPTAYAEGRPAKRRRTSGLANRLQFSTSCLPSR